MKTILITAIIVFLLQEYRHSVIKPVRFEKPKPLLQEWRNFIESNINSCFTEEHCIQCTSLIYHFDRKFRSQTPPEIFNDLIEKLWNRLDTKYRIVRHEEQKLSNVTVDQLLSEA